MLLLITPVVNSDFQYLWLHAHSSTHSHCRVRNSSNKIKDFIYYVECVAGDPKQAQASLC